MPLALRLAQNLRGILIVNAVENRRGDGRLLEPGGFTRRDVEGLPVDHRPVGLLVHLHHRRALPEIVADPALTVPALRIGLRRRGHQRRQPKRQRPAAPQHGPGVQPAQISPYTLFHASLQYAERKVKMRITIYYI